MARVDVRAAGGAGEAERLKPPSVLVILVAKDGAGWLPRCMRALARQTHPRMGVLAIDNGSTDRSADLLESALGRHRVVRMQSNLGFPGAVAQALCSELARHADYVLFLHDDTQLAPDAVALLVDVAERVEDAGVVGPKILDWEDPRILREIGLSADRFGHPYSPLEEGEVDHGQYDRIREALFVSSSAMLVSREAWMRVGPPDHRLTSQYEDLDFCWRARLAGFRVLVAPAAVARHREATLRGERDGSASGRAVYDRERAALASILKNYRAIALWWILSLYFLQGLGRLAILAVTRRWKVASQVVAAWGWNAANLDGTLKLRRHVQAIRTVSDRRVKTSMVPTWTWLRRPRRGAFRPRLRWPSIRQGERVEAERQGLVRFFIARPAAAAWALSALLAVVAYRHLFGASPLVGGALAAFPSSPFAFFRELVSGVRHTGLGGTEAASPSLGLLGLGSVATFGHPALLQKILLLGLPAGAGLGCYRSVRRVTRYPVAAIVAGACYGLSAAVLWAFSEGRLAELVFLAGVPWLALKVFGAFDRDSPAPMARWLVRTGIGMALLGSFFPGVALAAGVLLVAAVVVPTRDAPRFRELARFGGAVAVGAVLLFPLTLELVRSAGTGLAEAAGTSGFEALARLSLGTAPGSSLSAYYLPAAATLALVFVEGPAARLAARAGLASALSVYLAWLSAAGHLPQAMSNPAAYVGVAAFGYALLVGLGLTALLPRMARASLRVRHLGAGVMVAVLAAGLCGQVFHSAKANWGIGGPGRLAAGYPVVRDAPGSSTRILWLGSLRSDVLPAPGGAPAGEVPAGSASVRFAITGSSGASILDLARPARGSGYDYLRQALVQILAGKTHHGGALLGPLGVRYIAAASGDLPGEALRKLARQADLDAVPAEGLIVLENAKALPPAGLIGEMDWVRAARSGRLAGVVRLPAPAAQPLSSRGDVVTGPSTYESGLVLLSQQFDPRWRLVATGRAAERPSRAFGWALGFRSPDHGRALEVRYRGQRARSLEIALLCLLWLPAAWLTRTRVRRE
jgi:GT2 family glycosyltransferase